MNANTILNRSGSPPEFPANGSVWERLNFAVKYAGMVVGMHEWQPWHFRIRNDAVELSGLPPGQSRMAAGDWQEQDEASLRQVIMRSGVALFHLRLALKNFGCLGKVELFPDMAESGLIAKIHHNGGNSAVIPGRTAASGGAMEAELFQAMSAGNSVIPARHERANVHSSLHTSNSGREVDGALLEMFEQRLGLDAAEKAWLEFAASEASHDRLVDFASPNGKPTGKGKGWLTFIVRPGDRNSLRVQTGGLRAEDMAALGMIKTKTDDKHGWLAAGQAMAKASLQAKAWGISSQIFDQSFTDRRLREGLRTSIGHKGYVQAIMGFGGAGAQNTSAEQWHPLSDRHESVGARRLGL